MDDLGVTVVTGAGPGSLDPVVELVGRVTEELGRPALSEHKRRELDHLVGFGGGTTGSSPAALVVATADARTVGVAHLSGLPNGGAFAVELVVEGPGGRTGAAAVPERSVADHLLEAVLDQVGRFGGGTVRLWAAHASDADDALAAAHGFHLERDLIQMRCTLPLPSRAAGDGGESGPGAALPLRAFRPGRDEEAWLEVNNLSFADHPEQGHWEMDEVLEREGDPWFDPEGFLVLEVDGRIEGSCWTKVHADTDPPLGEIYVIGVRPSAQGRGWGRALTAAGLDWLAGKGLRQHHRGPAVLLNGVRDPSRRPGLHSPGGRPRAGSPRPLTLSRRQTGVS
jgi:mycothiol synthase